MSTGELALPLAVLGSLPDLGRRTPAPAARSEGAGTEGILALGYAAPS